MPNLAGMPDSPQVASYEAEAIAALIRPEIELPTDITSVVHALRGIGWAILHSTQRSAVNEMVDHCAEHDHVLELRLIDADVFGVRCTGEHCQFRAEWRT